MKLKLLATAAAFALCAIASQGFADEAAAKKWIDIGIPAVVACRRTTR